MGVFPFHVICKFENQLKFLQSFAFAAIDQVAVDEWALHLPSKELMEGTKSQRGRK